MILPIKLTDQLGLPGEGVPAFAVDPATGAIIGASSFPAAASGLDPATGEPMTTDSAASFTDDPGLWQTRAPVAGYNSILNTQSLQDTRGTQWSRHGSQQSESGFDRWRRAGKPTACSMRGFGDWSGTLQAALTAGIVGADAATLPAGTVVQSTANGITIMTPGTVSSPGGVIPYTPGALTATATANPLGWVLGIAVVAGLFYMVSQR